MPPKALSEKVVVGERLALFSYYKVDKIDKEYVHCTDENGQGVRIGKPIVNHSCVSTTQYPIGEEKVTRTRLAVIMEGLGHAPFRVTFNKQVKPNVVADGLSDADLTSQAKRRKVVKTLMEGEERVMHARLWRSHEDDVEMEQGRYKVVDLEKSEPKKPAQRLVDTRTIKELIVEGTRYYVG
jgi:hypothetical protein